MRPTLLNFRSPKEKTPSYFDPKMTYDGRFLAFNSPKGSGKTSNFSNEKRFSWYKHSQGGGFRVGPGSYTPMCSRYGKDRVICGSPYRDLHVTIENSNNVMVGDQIVVDREGSFQRTIEKSNGLLRKNLSDDTQNTSRSRYLTPEVNRKNFYPSIRKNQSLKRTKGLERKVSPRRINKNQTERVKKLLKSRFKSLNLRKFAV